MWGGESQDADSAPPSVYEGSFSHPLSTCRLSESARLNSLWQKRQRCCDGCAECCDSWCRLRSCARENDLSQRSHWNRSISGDGGDGGWCWWCDVRRDDEEGEEDA